MRDIHEDDTEAEIDVADMGDLTVEFTRRVRWEYDPAYGADADGYRGTAQWFFDELEPVITAVTTLDGELLHLRSTELAKVEAALDRWLKDNPPEPPTQDEP